jgi:hypothetical protein
MNWIDAISDIVDFEKWLENTDEGYAYAKRKYEWARDQQLKADNPSDQNYWDSVSFKWANEMADIKAVMADTYQKEGR